LATLSRTTPAIAELQTAAPAAALRKELGFTDLVLSFDPAGGRSLIFSARR